MENINNNIDSFLPFGESLRLILQHPSINQVDISRLLKIKGIYVGDKDDSTTFPLLLTNFLNPYEFDSIKESLKGREDREKPILRTLDWISDTNLINAIPSNLDVQDIIKTIYPKYNVIGNPNFEMIERNPNNIIMKFNCESHDYSKAWFRTSSISKGSITLEKSSDKEGKVQLQIIHTSPETTEIANKVATHLEKHFKENKHTNPEIETEKLTFGRFTNEQRIDFFLKFTEGSDNLKFTKVSYLDIAPSPELNLPKDINWLELAKVKELNINGENLHKIHFIKEKELHKYMELCEMTILYDFILPNYEGNCNVRFGFFKFFKKE